MVSLEAARELRKWDYLARKRRILRRIWQIVRPRLLISWPCGGLGGDKIKGKHAVSWTIEFGRETPKDGDGVK